MSKFFTIKQLFYCFQNGTATATTGHGAPIGVKTATQTVGEYKNLHTKL
jgi:hypothetical protein